MAKIFIFTKKGKKAYPHSPWGENKQKNPYVSALWDDDNSVYKPSVYLKSLALAPKICMNLDD